MTCPYAHGSVISFRRQIACRASAFFMETKCVPQWAKNRTPIVIFRASYEYVAVLGIVSLFEMLRVGLCVCGKQISDWWFYLRKRWNSLSQNHLALAFHHLTIETCPSYIPVWNKTNKNVLMHENLHFLKHIYLPYAMNKTSNDHRVSGEVQVKDLFHYRVW